MPSTTVVKIRKTEGDSKLGPSLLKDLQRSPADSRYLPQLDGVRAFAILLVLMCHDIDTIASVPILPVLANVGWIGVDLFFVLSGFLITSNLIRGERSGNFLRSFYTRRALRIWPLYFGLLLASFIYQELVGFRQHVPWGYCLLLVQNFWPVHLVKALKATWSLCIEEHYYLVWPLLVLSLPKRWLPYLLGFLFLSMPAMRMWGVSMGLSGKALKTFTPFHLDGILLGSLIAVVLSLWKPGKEALCWTGTVLMVGGGLVAVPLLSRYLDDVAQTAVWAYWWVGLAMAGLVLLLIGSPPRRWWSRMFSAPSIVYVGKISYGMYLLHDLTFAFLDRLPIFRSHHPSWILSLGIFGLRMLVVIAIASVSWKFFERPLLRFKDKIAPLNHSNAASLLARPSE